PHAPPSQHFYQNHAPLPRNVYQNHVLPSQNVYQNHVSPSQNVYHRPMLHMPASQKLFPPPPHFSQRQSSPDRDYDDSRDD
ncbi:MAG: hypothetical protein SGCHY_004741, partial [Lobulomycetales sp.]